MKTLVSPRLTLVSAAIALALLAQSAKPLWATPHPAQSAARFVDSIGISAGPPQSAEGAKKWRAEQMPLLLDLGVHYIRTDIDTFQPDAEEIYRELGDKGIVTMGLFDPRRPEWNTAHTPAQAVAMLMRVGPKNMIVEGPNEPDLINPEYRFAYKGLQMPEHPEGVELYMKELYEAVKTNPQTKEVPVVAPSMGNPHNTKVTDFSDYIVAHPYGPGVAPGWHFDIAEYRKVWGQKPLMISETGDHTAVYKTDGLWQPGVPEDVQAKNTARIPFYWFKQGVYRTFIFSFSDGPDPFNSQHNFGMVRSDNSVKPGYTALKSIIALLQNPGAAYAAKPLDYTMTIAGEAPDSKTPGVQSVLLQKRDGRHYLALWQNINSFDPQALKALDNPLKKVTLQINAPIAGANIYAPTTNGTTPIAIEKGRSFTVNVPDHPILVELALKPEQIAQHAKPMLAQVPGVRPAKTPTGAAQARPIKGNEIVNYGFEAGALAPWNDYGTGSKVAGDHVFGGTKAVKIGEGNGKGGVNIGLALRPNTKYVAQMMSKVERDGRKARLTIAPTGMTEAAEVFANTDWKPIRVAFSTGADGSTQLYFWKDGGEGAAWGDNFIVTTPENLSKVEAAIAAQELKPIGLNTTVAPVNVSAAPKTVNLLANGGFESGALGAWQDYGSKSQVLKAETHGGDFAVRVGPQGGINLNATGLKPNTNYVFRAWTKLSAGANARLTVQDFGGAAKSAFLIGEDWKQNEVAFTTGPDKTSASLLLWKDTGDGFAWGDNFELIEP